MKKIFCLIIIIFCGLCLVGCQGENSNVLVPINVNDIVINKTHAYVNVGERLILTAQVYPFNADNQNILWRSDNIGVASVDDGIVVGNNEGRTVITCKSEDGEFEDKCIIYVSTPKLNYNKYPNNLAKTNIENKVLQTQDEDFEIDKEFSFSEDMDSLFGLQEEFFEKTRKLIEQKIEENLNSIKNLTNKNISQKIEFQNLENEQNLDEKSGYFYEYKYNSNGIENESDENVIYKDDNTLIKYSTF